MIVCTRADSHFRICKKRALEISGKMCAGRKPFTSALAEAKSLFALAKPRLTVTHIPEPPL